MTSCVKMKRYFDKVNADSFGKENFVWDQPQKRVSILIVIPLAWDKSDWGDKNTNHFPRRKQVFGACNRQTVGEVTWLGSCVCKHRRSVILLIAVCTLKCSGVSLVCRHCLLLHIALMLLPEASADRHCKVALGSRLPKPWCM